MSIYFNRLVIFRLYVDKPGMASLVWQNNWQLERKNVLYTVCMRLTPYLALNVYFSVFFSVKYFNAWVELILAICYFAYFCDSRTNVLNISQNIKNIHSLIPLLIYIYVHIYIWGIKDSKKSAESKKRRDHNEMDYRPDF